MQNEHTALKNIRWINYMRAIAMIAIYYIHAQEFFEYTVKGIGRYIYPFYVNAFFFVSGYLMFKKQISAAESTASQRDDKKFLLNILFRMVIPSIFFSILFFVPGSILQGGELSVISFIEKTIWGNTFWFISALVVAELLLFLMFQNKISNMLIYVFTGAVCFAAGYCIGLKNSFIPAFSSHPWHYEKGLMAIIFLVSGGLYRKYEAQTDQILFKPYTIAALLLMYVLPLVFLNRHIQVLISMDDINAAGAVISLVSILLLLAVCKSIRGINRVTNHLDYIGKHTIGLYFVCGAIPKVLMKVLPKIIPKGTVFYMLAGFVLSFVLAEAAVFLLEKYTPFLFDLRKGFYHKKRDKC